jgi:hypothetical protein
MKFFSYPIIFLLFISCSLIEEEDESDFDYYEPIIGEEFETVVDMEYKVEYEYSSNSDLYIESTDRNGLKYSIEIPSKATALGSFDNFSGYIAPLSGIQNLPADAEFQFGIEIEPYGIQFTKPVRITIDLPGNYNTQNLLGFYNEGMGGIAYLEPLKIKRSADKIQAIFDVMHFSSYGGLSYDGEDYSCPDARSARTCADLKEIIGCTLGSYEVGINEEMSKQDRDAVNPLLRAWMEEQLKYADHSTLDYSDRYEFEYELREYLCWKAMTKYYNSVPETVFGDLFDQAEVYIINAIEKIMNELDVYCLDALLNEPCWNDALEYSKSFIEWLVIAQEIGIENAPGIIELTDFCNGSINEVLYDFTMINAETWTEFEKNEVNENLELYFIELESTGQVIQIDYLMLNALDDLVEIDESGIEWIDVTQWGGQEKGNFIYEDGLLRMNPDLITFIGLCPPDFQACDNFVGEFEIYKDDCFMANVVVSWSRY